MHFAKDFKLIKINKNVKKNIVQIIDRYLFNLWRTKKVEKLEKELMADLKSDPYQFLDFDGFKNCIEKIGVIAFELFDAKNFPS